MNKINELKNSFIDYIKIEKSFSAHTIKAYCRDLDDFIEFLSGFDIDGIKCISADIIQQYLFFLRSRKYEYSSIERKLSTLKSFFLFLINTETIIINPAKDTPFPKKKKSLPVFLSQQEIVTLLEKEPDPSDVSYRDSAILELLYGSGIRLSELHKLDIESVDFDNKQIRVEGKGNKPRIVPINDLSIQKILLYFRHMRNDIADKKEKALFISRKGRRLCQRHLAKIVKKLSASALGRMDISPHSIRHSYATHLLENGAEIEIISKLLGHSSINTTQKYTHLNLQKIKETYLKSHPHSRPAKTDDNPKEEDENGI